MTDRIDNYFANGAQWLDGSYTDKHSVAVERFELIKYLIQQIKPQSLLDIGCGDGRLLKNLDFIKRRVGADYSEDMLKRASADCTEIDYCKLDLNSNLENNLSSIGKFDLITMMGVIHYLKNPMLSLSVLCESLNDGGRMAVSFRNRLFNIFPKSKYSLSELTVTNYPHLVAEANFWLGFDPHSSALLEQVTNDNFGCKLLNEVRMQNCLEGVTDPEWNVDSFEHWRQFTPLEAILLFDRVGLTAEAIYALHCEGVYHQNIDKNINAPCHLPMSTSFVVIGRMA